MDMQSETKLYLITGANSGIGRETAFRLAEKGNHVVMLCRSQRRGKEARKKIIEKTGDERVDLLLVDLSDQADVKKGAATFLERYRRLDVLINNAGAMFFSRQESTDGIEMTLAVNHVGHFILTNLLLDCLAETGGGRIITVASDSHFNGKIHFDDINLNHNYSMMKAYAQAKLANILFANELARRLAAKNSTLTSNSLHPGFVATGIGKNNGLLMTIAMTLLRPFQLSVEKGAETILYLATSPDVADINGHYFKDCKPHMPAEAARDEEAARRLWRLTAEKLVKIEGVA